MSIYILSHEMHNIYNLINEAISAKQQKVALPYTDGDAVLAIYNKVLSENPDGIFYNVGSIKIVSSLFGSSSIILSKNNMAGQIDRLIAERNKIVSIAQSERNNYEAILAVYRYFVQFYQYSDCDDALFHQIASPLQHHKSVCEGFSLLFSEILNMAHIPCGVVNGLSNRDGKQEPHSWNIVKYKNYYYHLDVTWDICSKSKQEEGLDYFMLDDNSIQKDHFWRDSFIPKCLDPNEEYYVKHDMLLRSKDEIERFLIKRIKMGNNTICFRCIDSQKSVLISDNSLSEIVCRAFKNCDKSSCDIEYRTNYPMGIVVINILG